MKHLRILLIVLAAAVAPLAYSQALNPGPDQGSAGLLNQNEGLKSVKLYPNPSIEYLSVKFESPIAKRVKLNVHNIIGSEMPLESEVVDDFELHVKVKDFSAGVYLLSIRNDETGHKSAFKFLKK